MRTLRRLAAVIVLGVLLVLLSLAIVQQVGHAAPGGTTRYVAPGGNCGGASPCYATVQAAVDAAADGDTVKIAQGTYTDIHAHNHITQVVYLDKELTLQGGYVLTNWTTPDPAAHPAVLDAQGKGRVFYVKGSGAVIRGVRITGGDAKGQGGTSWGDDVGGGIFVDNTSFTIRDCEIDHNTADGGSGIYLRGGNNIRVQECHIHHNQGQGAAVTLFQSSRVTISGNLVEHNVGGNHGWGGGMDVSSTAQVAVHNNSFLSNETPFYGGGISIAWGEDISLTDNLILGNEASEGGGVFLYFSNAYLARNRILSNKASWIGGGVSVGGAAPSFENNVVSDNQGARCGGIVLIRSSPRFVHTTLARNQGVAGLVVRTFDYGGERTPSHVVMTDTIVFSQTVGISIDKDSTVQADATLWQSNGKNWDGAGTITHTHDYSGDPKFAWDGYHLLAGSAAIDKGVDAGVSTDIDGDHRPYGTGYDLGADEYNGTAQKAKRLYMPIALRRGS